LHGADPSRANRRVTILPMGGDLPQNKKLEIDAAEFRLCGPGLAD